MARVVVVGGGYGGITVAKGLDSIADVVLVESKDQFVHNAAALRGTVDDVWQQAMFMPYSYLLSHGEVVQGTVASVEGTTVKLYGQDPVEGDFVVFATGSTYPFPAKQITNQARIAQRRLEDLRGSLQNAERVLLVGGGTVGLELAGELKAFYPGMEVVVVEKEDQILPWPEYSDAFRDLVRQQAADMGIQMLEGAPLAYLPPNQPGQLGRFKVETTKGEPIEADMWFQCYGSKPITGYLRGTDYDDALNDDGTVRVLPTMQVAGHDHAFAVGDITDVNESKRADAARNQARTVVANIAAMIEGEDPKSTYTPRRDWIVLPLGPDHGASQIVDEEGKTRIVGANETAEIKGSDLMVSVMRSQLGLP